MGKRSPVQILDIRTSRDRTAFERLMAARRRIAGKQLASASTIVEGVRRGSDAALFKYTRQFDNVLLTARSVRVSQTEIARAAKKVPCELSRALAEAATRIRRYHTAQSMKPFRMRTAEGVLSQEIRPLRRVGVYVPGGHTVYPSSVLMNVIPAQVAGVDQIVVVTPPRDGLSPVLACALKLLGVSEVYRVGGAQAIAALAYGTRSIPAVDKIVGPGRNVVALAKRLVYGVVDIDMIAGSSEVAILADRTADPVLVALDMLAQAEHGSGDEVAVCVCESMTIATAVAEALDREIAASPVKQVFARLANSALTICVTASRADSLVLIDRIAPEHLQIMTRSPRADLARIRNAGAVFLGQSTPVALGDYFIGTNHVLPTSGAASYASALGTDDFQKRISVAEVTPAGLRGAACHVSVLARAEAFVHHALSVEYRAADAG